MATLGLKIPPPPKGFTVIEDEPVIQESDIPAPPDGFAVIDDEYPINPYQDLSPEEARLRSTDVFKISTGIGIPLERTEQHFDVADARYKNPDFIPESTSTIAKWINTDLNAFSQSGVRQANERDAAVMAAFNRYLIDEEGPYQQKIAALGDSDLELVSRALIVRPNAATPNTEKAIWRERKVREAVGVIKSLPNWAESAYIIAQRRSNLFNINDFTSRTLGIERLWGLTGGETSIAIEAAERVMAEKRQEDFYSLLTLLDIGAGTGQILLEFVAIPDVTSKIAAFGKLPKVAQRVISVSTRFGLREAVSLPRAGETLGERAKEIGISTATGAVLGATGGKIINPFLKVGRVAGVTGGFMGITAVRGGDVEQIIETGIMVLGFQAYGLVKSTSAKLRVKMDRVKLASAIKAVRKHNPDLKGIPDKAIGEVLEGHRKISWWQDQYKKGKVTENVMVQRVNEELSRIQPIGDAIAKNVGVVKQTGPQTIQEAMLPAQAVGKPPTAAIQPGKPVTPPVTPETGVVQPAAAPQPLADRPAADVLAEIYTPESIATRNAWIKEKMAKGGKIELDMTKAPALVEKATQKPVPEGKAEDIPTPKTITSEQVVDNGITVEADLPPVQEGLVRLYRGQHPQQKDLFHPKRGILTQEEIDQFDPQGKGGWFTKDLVYALQYAQAQGKGWEIAYIDVSTDVAEQHAREGFAGIESEFFFPELRNLPSKPEVKPAPKKKPIKKIKPDAPTIQGESPAKSIGEPGFDKLTPLIVEKAIDEVTHVVKKAGIAAKGFKGTIEFYTSRAAEYIEKHYGEPGKQLAHDTREVAFTSARHFSKQWHAAEKVLSPLTHKDRIRVMEIGQGRRVDKAIKARLKPQVDALRVIMDADMIEAASLGYKRLVGSRWRELKGSGNFTPQVLNDKGRTTMIELRQQGVGSPRVKAAVENMVASGQASSETEALAMLVDWNNKQIRSGHGYFESTRTLLPKSLVEFDPDKIIPSTLQRNADMIEAARVWGVQAAPAPIEIDLFGNKIEPDIKQERLDFTKARALIEEIGKKYGQNEEEVLKKWLRANFGGAVDINESVANFFNTLNAYETNMRLGWRVPSAGRNLLQGDVNMFTAPLSAHLAALKTVVARRWSKAAKELYDQVTKSGAIVGQKELAEVEKGPTGEPVTPGLALRMFSLAEESNHMRAALIARFAAEENIKDILKLQAGGKLQQLIQSLKYLSINPEKFLRDLVKNRTFTNVLTDAEFERVLSTPLTLDDFERIMHRASVDTQFIQNLATRPIPHRSNPILRGVMKFKTFGINQTRLIWQDATKQAVKGTLAPLAKYLLFAVVSGEIYNLMRDALFGRDESLTITLIKRPEKRIPKDIALKLMNNFVDGAGLGVLTDVTWGVGNFLIGPIGQTVENVLQAFSDWRTPYLALRELVKQELAVSRDVEGLFNRADTAFFNDNNKYFEYARWRDRSFEFKHKISDATTLDKIERATKEVFLGRPQYEKKLPYEYAARQITYGDIDDAADYLADHISANIHKGEDKLEASMRSSMNSHAPFANIPDDKISKFMAQFPLSERSEGKKLQRDWIKDYEKAIKKAFKLAKKM